MPLLTPPSMAEDRVLAAVAGEVGAKVVGVVVDGTVVVVEDEDDVVVVGNVEETLTDALCVLPLAPADGVFDEDSAPLRPNPSNNATSATIAATIATREFRRPGGSPTSAALSRVPCCS